jgi:hypothetical protein
VLNTENTNPDNRCRKIKRARWKGAGKLTQEKSKRKGPETHKRERGGWKALKETLKYKDIYGH